MLVPIISLFALSVSPVMVNSGFIFESRYDNTATLFCEQNENGDIFNDYLDFNFYLNNENDFTCSYSFDGIPSSYYNGTSFNNTAKFYFLLNDYYIIYNGSSYKNYTLNYYNGLNVSSLTSPFLEYTIKSNYSFLKNMSSELLINYNFNISFVLHNVNNNFINGDLGISYFLNSFISNEDFKNKITQYGKYNTDGVYSSNNDLPLSLLSSSNSLTASYSLSNLMVILGDVPSDFSIKASSLIHQFSFSLNNFKLDRDINGVNGYQDGYDNGYNQGLTDGATSGYNNGYQVGYNKGLNENSGLYNIWNSTWGGVTTFLNTEIFPGVSLWLIMVVVPISVSLVLFILKLIR